MDISLAGKVALVTGAGPNIGGGIGLALARYGATVACNDIDPDAAAAAVERIERNGGRAIAVPGDVTDEDQVAGYVDQVVGELGGIDILVNNAALLGGKGCSTRAPSSSTAPCGSPGWAASSTPGRSGGTWPSAVPVARSCWSRRRTAGPARPG